MYFPSRLLGIIVLVSAFLLQSCATTAPGQATSTAPSPVTGIGLVDEIDGIVREHYYSPQRLEQLGWNAAVARARTVIATASESARVAVIEELMASLRTSHTNYLPRNDPAYWQMASIFAPVISRLCPAERIPKLPIEVNDIGVFWKKSDSRWFVGGVYAGGPAEKAGLKLGDEILSADEAPFSPVQSFANKSSGKVTLTVREQRSGPTRAVVVTPQKINPQEALLQATENSWRIIQRGSQRIAYVRIWAWTSIEIQQVVLQAITKSNQERVDGFVLDLRDGWGGASPHYLSIFTANIPILESRDRDGTIATYDAQIRKPAVLLTNGGTRSGKELIAYGAKKHKLARLIGERTAGAVVFGQPFCLSDGSLLYLAVNDASVDGQRLEGVGVEPDVSVPFDFRYAGGQDLQLERAVELLSVR